MRVIAGHLRSRPLRAPAGAQTRPTSDRLRETLFNVLAPRIERAQFADLYAGTGAVGIEALSRGATHVLFVERAAASLAALRANLRTLGLTEGVTVSERSVAATLGRAVTEAPRVPFSIVFLDPPYDAANEYTDTLGLLGSKAGQVLLAPGALVIAEHGSRTPLPERFGNLTRRRVLRQGDASLSFFEQQQRAEATVAATAELDL